MSYLGSRVALLRFRNTEIIFKQPLQKVLRRRVLIYRRICCMLSLQKFKYSVTPPTVGW